MPRDHVELVMKGVDAANRGDPDAFAACLHPDVEWEERGDPLPVTTESCSRPSPPRAAGRAAQRRSSAPGTSSGSRTGRSRDVRVPLGLGTKPSKPPASERRARVRGYAVVTSRDAPAAASLPRREPRRDDCQRRPREFVENWRAHGRAPGAHLSICRGNPSEAAVSKTV
jgi:hypothetical protein